MIVTADHETGYLTGPDSGQRPDGPVWNPPVDNGQGVQPSVQWNKPSHTNSLVPFYAKGSAARRFKKAVKGSDPVRGEYIDNTAIGRVAFEILGAANPNQAG